MLRLSWDCRAALSAEDRLDAGLIAARSDKDRAAGADRFGKEALSKGVDAVATERTWLVCERDSARATAEEDVDVGSLIVETVPRTRG